MFPMPGFGQEPPPPPAATKTWPLVLGVVGVGTVLAFTLYLTRDRGQEKPAPRMSSNPKRVQKRKSKPKIKTSTSKSTALLAPSAPLAKKPTQARKKKHV
jgi:hypothetical protein